ncbi:isoprenyl transferase [Photobacterium aquimaris]|uniref:Ditrans,polycis-undecaprenyl-diphosphate synthase ((2E,6E)-farnesyl-diphosphate specific) n=1 Tax=Photobacterium aquimaris TaxID=512643 RepID=A0A2T3HXT3_9GAMM|nr:isoprenyl transferase [Photobacterium aquimaris]MCP4954754.1 isoprenyl transferase [Photobacterium aquimaris]OBU24427.1 di-trans,poly-cis-decaprenylcistransferase [Photobacterium aquimaris]PQJ41829.1 di-trans,poly-cis-decaprenylcistransferase [Photobacterium aquimaris]PSU04397.1 isoprenyl transferase [Photobacterium aquimaris]
MAQPSIDAVPSADYLPQHIAVIMDGNGRWAKAKGKARVFGHKAGVEAVRKTVSTANRLGIKVVTLFAFSSENWRRPEDEVSLLMELFMTVLGREVKRLHKNNIRLCIIGDKSRFSARLQKKIAAAELLTEGNTGLVLNVAANYGGQWDILQATKQMMQRVIEQQLDIESLTEKDLEQGLVTQGLPNVDLLIRTSGECRISNFMLWQTAYAELYFTEQHWPDFDEQSLVNAVAWFVNRERRFGCTGEQIQALLK